MVGLGPGVQSRFLNVSAGRMHYFEAGQGNPVVCVHGNPTHAFFFRSTFVELAPDFRVLALDHLGCGASSLPRESDYAFRLNDRVRDLSEFLVQLNLQDRLTLILHDWGGMIGLLYAVRNPERVERIVLLNTAGFGLPAGKRFPRSLWLCRLPLLGALLVRGLNLFCRGAARYCVTKRPLPPEIRQAYLGPYGSWKRRLAVHRFVQDIPLTADHPSHPFLLECETGLDRLRKIPRLVCWAGRDFIFDGAFLAEWRRRWPDAEYELYPDAGHYLLEDEPLAAPRRIRRFLQEHPIQA